ncbi:hypothetical protein AB0M20_09645 [Actinoplanes sp. NPDC051633]|uniref:hypothetical protein n=1 Tax=Actinoplanes sp. NPDC051633 TaxID=3155670 RepID=UPI00342881BA
MCPLTWQADTGPQSTHISVHGTADAFSMRKLQAMLKRHLARRPTCLILDLPDMSASDRVVVTSSSPSAECGTMASGTTVLLCADLSTDLLMHHHQRGRGAALTRRFARAREVLTVGLLRSPSFVEQLLPISGAPRRTRDIVTQACLAWGLTHLTGAATMLASEMVSRTIRQASTIMTVVALLDRDVLYLWVRASSAPAVEPPDERAAALEAVVIDTLADHWGHLRDGPEAVTWAALPIHTAAR